MAQTVSCPICGKQVPLDDPNMPFCSDRCRLLDLGNWASESYVISTPTAHNELEDAPEPEPPLSQAKDRIQ
ncbi:MAG TPA: DNA gyrase inhibitor YacG [Bryobacteraceae bacterium]|nr:DNA gyrase inhibitor YacG [Bryobacteraceae bacterium]